MFETYANDTPPRPTSYANVFNNRDKLSLLIMVGFCSNTATFAGNNEWAPIILICAKSKITIFISHRDFLLFTETKH